MELRTLEIPDVKLLIPKRFGDARGVFCETWNRKALDAAGLRFDFVQDNQSLSIPKYTVRGLHYQLPPCVQAKLVRVVRGSILDVAVDIRRSSPTFGQHVKAILSAENWTQMLVPEGFAHGFVTLEPNTEVIYKVTAYYSPQHDRGIQWNDPALGIEWGCSTDQATLSEKDAKLPELARAEVFG